MAVWNSMLQKIIIIPLGVVWQHVRFIWGKLSRFKFKIELCTYSQNHRKEKTGRRSR